MCYRKRVFNNPFSLSPSNSNAAAATTSAVSNNLNSNYFKNTYNQLIYSINSLNSKQNAPLAASNTQYCCFFKAPSWSNLNLAFQNTQNTLHNSLNLSSHTYPGNSEQKVSLRRWNSTIINNQATNNNKHSLKNNSNHNLYNENETIRLKSQDCIDRIHNCEYKYLEPPKPKPGRLIIKQEPDTFAPSPPPIVVVKSPQPTFTPPTKMYRQRPPKSPEHIDEIVTIPGKKITPPQKTIIIEKPSNNQKIVSEIWKPYPVKEINVEVVKEKSKLVNNSSYSKKNFKKLNDLDYLKIIEEIDWASVIIDQLKTKKIRY